ncbi:MAG: restriction endonuclease subunit S [bacterium]|nr:restriction endonuclease subunit S [bacterium]
MITQTKTTRQRIKLEDVAEKISSGGTPSRLHPEYFTADRSGHLWVKSKELLDAAIEDTEEKITDDALNNSSAKYYPEHTVLIAMYGANVGQLGWLKKKATVNQAVCGLIIDEDKADWRYVFYSLLQNRDDLIVQARGAAQQNLNQDLIRNFEIPTLKLEDQRNVGSILGTYDNLIENNTKRIKILEEMAQAIYKEWFVYFRFPGYEKVKMIDSETEFGKVPKGWKVEKLGDKIKILRGKNITKNTIVPGKVPVVAGGMGPAYFHNKANVEGPAITISASGANSGYINLYHEDIWASDCSYINKNSTPFVYYYFLLLKNRQVEVTGLQRGSAQPHVYPKDLARLLIIDPPEELTHSFEEKAKSTFNMINNFQLQNQNLRQARDLLLPKLVNGEISV